MSSARDSRAHKRQLGQYMTPFPLAQQLVEELPLTPEDRILEPSMGTGAFILPLIERCLSFYAGSTEERLASVLQHNIFGAELDPELYEICLAQIAERFGPLPRQHNFVIGDFFELPYQPESFEWIIGNPPFGGTFPRHSQDALDRQYGKRLGEKIKKETYSFFTVRSVELLSARGHLRFICSDTFLTIPTMRGLRRWLMAMGTVEVSDLLHHFPEGFAETDYPMVILDLAKNINQDFALINNEQISREAMEMTGNFSWQISNELMPWFQGEHLGDYLTCSSGMTVGKNELFVREIRDNAIIEPYDFVFFDDLITLDNELSIARLGKISLRKQEEIITLEQAGTTRRNVRVIPRNEPVTLPLPQSDYLPLIKQFRQVFIGHRHI